MKYKEIICIACPRGCCLKVSREANGILVNGNKCPKGEAYGWQELVCPMRTLTTTIQTTSKKHPRLPVKLSCEVPFADFSRYLQEIKQICCCKSVHPGEIIKENILGKGVNLIATGEFII